MLGVSVSRGSSEISAAERARWLADLALAIDQAQKLVWRLGVSEGDNAEAKDLYERLESARAEVESLRLGGFAGANRQPDPEWMKSLFGRESK